MENLSLVRSDSRSTVDPEPFSIAQCQTLLVLSTRSHSHTKTQYPYSKTSSYHPCLAYTENDWWPSSALVERLCPAFGHDGPDEDQWSGLTLRFAPGLFIVAQNTEAKKNHAG
jgi:hypothetical protein